MLRSVRCMKLINYGDTDWLIGDDAADLLLEYSVLMAKGATADSLDVEVLTTEGARESVKLLIGPATMMTARPISSELEEPDNAETIADVRERINLIESPPSVQPSEVESTLDDYDI